MLIFIYLICCFVLLLLLFDEMALQHTMEGLISWKLFTSCPYKYRIVWMNSSSFDIFHWGVLKSSQTMSLKFHQFNRFRLTIFFILMAIYVPTDYNCFICEFFFLFLALSLTQFVVFFFIVKCVQSFENFSPTILWYHISAHKTDLSFDIAHFVCVCVCGFSAWRLKRLMCADWRPILIGGNLKWFGTVIRSRESIWRLSRNKNSIRTHTNSPKRNGLNEMGCMIIVFNIIDADEIHQIHWMNGKRNKLHKINISMFVWLCFTSTSRIIHLIVFDLKKLRL